MPIKKECTICKVRHPEHPKLINVKEFEGKYTQSIEKEEWELTFKKTFNRIDGIAVSPMAIPSNVFDELKQFIKSLLLSKEEEYKKEKKYYTNFINALLEVAKKKATLKK